MRGETGRGDDRKRPRGNDIRNDPRNERKDLFMKKTLWTLTSAAALLCVAAMATAEAPVAASAFIPLQTECRDLYVVVI